jgi:phosphoglycerate dehydrogenase-like enzyme
MSDKPKVLIYAPREEPQDVLDDLESAGFNLVIGDKRWQQPFGQHEDALVEAARDSVALMGTSIRATPISRRVLQTSQRLRLVAKYTVGVDDIDIEAATELGIMICHAPTEDNCFAVAESTMAMMLSLLKRLTARDAAVRNGGWRVPAHSGTFLGSRDSDGYPGITIGIVGLGRVGTRVAQLLAPWRVRLIAYDPHIEPMKFLLAGVKSVSYETLLRESDVISYHVVLTKETRFMCGERELNMMKPNALVINTARGKVVDEAALAKALAAGKIDSAAIDAFIDEPPGPDNPLLRLGDKVLMSPHATAFNRGGELRAGIDWAARSVHTALAGNIPDNVYNKEVIPKWRERFGGANVTG